MPPQIKQAKLREEFIKEHAEPCDGIHKGNCSGSKIDEHTDLIADWWLAKLSQAKLETLEAIIKEVEGVLNEETLQHKYPKISKSHTHYIKEVQIVKGYNWAIDRMRVVISDLLTKLQAQKELIENNK